MAATMEALWDYSNRSRQSRVEFSGATASPMHPMNDSPQSEELAGNFSLFMNDVRKDYDEAERLYRKALELDPNDADYAGNFASFMKDVRKDYDEAERLYRKALELDPNHADHTGNL